MTTDHAPEGLARVRMLAGDLRALGDGQAPPSLLPAVLVRAGIAAGFWPLATPLGPAFVAYNANGVGALAFGDDPAAFAAGHATRTGKPAYPLPAPPRLARAVERLLATGDRSGVRFDLRSRSAFERAVLEAVLIIPRGEVRPYGWVAREVGRPGAAPAVGTALRRNPVPVLIPCHRVVGADGAPGDHALDRGSNLALLASEGVPPDALVVGRGGARFLGSDTTGIFCFPTCRNARRITRPHRVPFTSAAAAVAAGYRPCKVCRPAPVG